jgi:hypothetical protein
MFEFYRDAIEWYLRSKFSRALASFNDNLVKDFTKAKTEIDEHINHFHEQASLSRTAMIAMVAQDVSVLKAEVRRQHQSYDSQDVSAGRRMSVLLEVMWEDRQFYKTALEATLASGRTIEPASRVQDVSECGITRSQARTYSVDIDSFIVGDEGAVHVGAGHSWLAEDAVLPKLRAWMIEDTTSRTIWISSPYQVTRMRSETTSAKAAALAVVSAAWQAETPLISHFCQRSQRNGMQAMSIEQVGLIGLVYSMISQLLQFGGPEDELDINEEALAALNGEEDSWDASLEVLRALLDRTPKLMFCVIDGLNELELRSGWEWSQQFLDVLIARQSRDDTVFNILLTTSGQSRILPLNVELEDRYHAAKGAREIARSGVRITL